MLKPEQIEAVCRLSPLQEGLLFHSMETSASPAYVVQHLVSIHGDLVEDAFLDCWHRIVDRHQALRASFHWKEAKLPLEVFSRSARIPIERLDWRMYDPVAREKMFGQFAAEDAAKGFDLSQAPLMRVALIRFTDDEWRLCWCYHHVILDGWSAAILARDVFAMYSARVMNAPVTLPPAPSYAEYLNRLQQADAAAAEAFWREHFADFTNPTPFGVEKTAARGSGPFETARATLGVALTSAVVDFGRKHGLTPSSITQTAWALLLSRYSGERDVVFGTVVSGRNTGIPGMENAAGLFINSLPVRVRVPQRATAPELLHRNQRFNLALQQYEYSRLDLVQRLSGIPRGASLFRCLFVFENYPVDDRVVTGAAGLRISEIRIIERTHYPLTVTIGPGADFGVFVRYDSSRFDAVVIERMIDHYRQLIAEICADPQTAAVALSMRTARDTQYGRVQAPGRVAVAPRTVAVEGTLHALFESQAKQRPDAVAVRWDDRVLTYSQLDRSSSMLATELRKRGVREESRVAIFLEPAAQTIIAILGVLKAGAAYVPVDTTYPRDRIEFMVRDSGACTVVSERLHSDALRSTGVPVVLLEDLESHARDKVSADRSTAANTAYVIYTSGSTGQPKGTLISHRNVIRLLTHTQQWFQFSPEDVWTLFHSCAFDFSVWEIWGALAYGGTLVVVPRKITRDPARFRQLLVHERVTVLNQTPSAFRQFDAADAAHEPWDLRLKWIIFGGEKLEFAGLAGWFERHGDTSPALVNMYGITETTVHVTFQRVRHADAHAGLSNTIGSPIPDLELYLLDENAEPIPDGVAGEICVSGPGLATGYLDRPRLTAERFTPNPFSGIPGDRMYRSGDVARRLATGALIYEGRGDSQVKVRGFRVELAEIEAALSQHASVRECAVIPDGVEGDCRLSAFVAPREGSRIDPSELVPFLRTRLPEHMIPARLCQLDALPLTSNGKLDRKALAMAARTTSPLVPADFVEPRNATEAALAEVWQEVLKLERVSIHDNYFNLGGDSIRSIQLRAAALRAGMDFGLDDLFRYPTVAQLAGSVRHVASPGEQHPLPFRLLPEADRTALPPYVEDALPLTGLQTGLLYHSALETRTHAYQCVMSLRLQGDLDTAVFARAVTELAARHPVLRTSFDLGSFSVAVQLVHRKATAGIEIRDLTSLGPDEQDSLISEWREQVVASPGISFVVQLLGHGVFHLGIRFHHALLDGWSLAMMIQDLFEVYRALLGQDGMRPAPPDAFPEFVRREQAAARSQQAKQFWSAKLNGVVPERRNARDSSGTRNEVCWTADADLTSRLQSVARSLGVPLKSVLLAAHCRVIALLGGVTDVVTGFIVNGRPEWPAAERSLGLFLNTVPLRIHIGWTSWKELIRAVAEAEADILPHQLYPLAEIQRLHDGRELFETAFNFVHFSSYNGLIENSGFRVLGQEFRSATSFPLFADFSLDPVGRSLTVTLEVDESVWQEQRLHEISAYYRAALESIASDVTMPASVTTVVGAAAHTALIQQRSAAPLSFDSGSCVHQWIEEQARATPDAPAVHHETGTLTYRELNEAAQRVSRALSTQGAGPERLVAVMMPRSPSLVIALLGIWKAGAAYVPLDPAYPAERTRLLLQLSRPDLILTSQPVASLVQGASAERILIGDLLEGRQLSADCVKPQPANLAYVLYTSGSTGVPKGVAIQHSSVAAFVSWALKAWTREQLSNVLASTSICFDLSIFELFVPLACGGCVELVDNALDLLRSTAPPASLLNTVPSVAAEMMRSGSLPRSIHCVNLAGEPLTARLAQQILDLPHVMSLYNLYGPTEDTTYSTVQRVARPVTGAPGLGRALSGTRLYLLDANLEPVLPGVRGQIYLAGEGLARGYFGRPGLTAERFLPDPFASAPGERMYRTGDLARYGDGGGLEFLGRRDHQIKLRGFRIELSEIESHLDAHPAVRECAVLLHESGETKRLIACVQTADSQFEPELLRAWLRSRLPDHLMPSAVVSVPHFPRTPNGKLDRERLSQVAMAEPAHTRPIDEPATTAERRLAQIWSDVLGSSYIDANSDFFAQGGDSLLSVRLCARAQAAGFDITPKDLASRRTLRELAAATADRVRVEPVHSSPEDSSAVALAPSQLFFLQDGIGNLNRNNISSLLRIGASLSRRDWDRIITAIVSKHSALRLRFRDQAGSWTAQVSPTEDQCSAEYIDLRSWPVSHQARDIAEMTEERQGTLDIAAGPLYRFTYFDTGDPQTSRVLFIVHHLACDGHSQLLLLQDLETAIHQIVEGAATILLPPVSVTWEQWTHSLAAAARSDRMQGAIDYWTRAAGAPDTGSSANTGVPDTEGDARNFTLTAELPTNVSVTGDALATALYSTISEWTGSARVRFEMIGHGRICPAVALDPAATVGYFAMRYPVQLDSVSGSDAVRRELDSIPDRGISWGMLRYLHPNQEIRDRLTAPSRPEISLNYHGQAGSHAGSLIIPTAESVGLTRDPGLRRACKLQLFATRTGNGVSVTWRFNPRLHDPGTMRTLAARFSEHLKTVIGCATPVAASFGSAS